MKFNRFPRALFSKSEEDAMNRRNLLKPSLLADDRYRRPSSRTQIPMVKGD